MLLKSIHKVSTYFPRWMFKFNTATLMSTTAPKIYFRKYKNYVFQKAVREDIPEMSLLSGTPEPLLAERFDAGDWCYITRAKTKGNKIVNMIWIHPGPCYIRGLGFALEAESHAAYLYGGYTSPQERMKGIFSTAFREVYDILRQRGITKLYGLIEDWNQQAYDYHLRLNFKPVTRVAFVIVMHVMVSIQENLETGEKKTNIFVSFPRDRVLI
jgi:GNAT superfamily N-acetyltransferase